MLKVKILLRLQSTVEIFVIKRRLVFHTQTYKQGLNTFPQYHPIKLLSGPWHV